MTDSPPKGWARLDRCRAFSEHGRWCQLYIGHQGAHAHGAREQTTDPRNRAGALHMVRWDDGREWADDNEDQALDWCVQSPVGYDVFTRDKDRSRCRSVSPVGRRCQLYNRHDGAHADAWRRSAPPARGRPLPHLYVTRWDEAHAWPDDREEIGHLRWCSLQYD